MLTIVLYLYIKNFFPGMYHIIEGGGGAQDSLAPTPTTTLFLNIFY